MTILDMRERLTELHDVRPIGRPLLAGPRAAANRLLPKPALSDLVVLANRLPVSVRDDGTTAPSAGGLVSALLPTLSRLGGAWVGWSGGVRRTDAVTGEHEGVVLHAVALSELDVADYYDGFANNTLWPLYHDAIRTPVYSTAWWDAYVRVNQRFARSAAAAAAPGATVWVHDYHLQLVPEMLRQLRPDVRIGFFLHIPFPPAELFAQLPWRKEILRGLLGADVIGFQEPTGAANFRRLARSVGATSGRGTQVSYEGRRIQARAFPISIDVDAFEKLATSPEVRARAREIRRELGSPDHVLLGVDRLDYTKGIDLRLRAYRELLEDGVIDARNTVMVQIAVPSRENVAEYFCQRELVERMVGEINGSFARVGTPAVHYLHRAIPLEELVALYCAADVMLVTPLRDGMNLVAKEYVASRVDQRGSLLLSEFAGAARELTAADLVNPHDIDDVKQALGQVLRRSPLLSIRKMQRLRKTVRSHDVYQWSDEFLAALREAG